MKKYDVVAMGELLIDFTENGSSSQGNAIFEANPGGAPCNVLAMLSKLGKKTAFIGKVGDDAFGKMLKTRVSQQNINTDNLVFDPEIPTTLAFVQTASDGDRSFSFYRNPGADMMLRTEEIDMNIIKNASIFHFGTLSMTDPKIEEVTKDCIKAAKESGCVLSFDPNLRPPLWSSLKEAKDKIEYGLSQCDILKISDDEILFLTGEEDIDTGIKLIQDQFDIKLICATLGKKGSKAFYKGMKVECQGYVQERTIETTGAGDTFCGCMLNAVLERGIDHLTREDLEEMLDYANGAASLITTRKGALCVMPEVEEIAALRKGK